MSIREALRALRQHHPVTAVHSGIGETLPPTRMWMIESDSLKSSRDFHTGSDKLGTYFSAAMLLLTIQSLGACVKSPSPLYEAQRYELHEATAVQGPPRS